MFNTYSLCVNKQRVGINHEMGATKILKAEIA